MSAPVQAVCSECGLAYLVDTRQEDAEWSCPRCGPSMPLGSEDQHKLWSLRRPRFRWRWRVPSSALLLLLLIPVLLTAFLMLEMHQLRKSRTSPRDTLARGSSETGLSAGARSGSTPRSTDSVSEGRTRAGEADSANPSPSDLPQSAADTTDTTDIAETAETADAEPWTLSQLLRSASAHQHQQLRFGCRFVRQLEDDSAWRIAASSDDDGAPLSDAGQPRFRLKLEDTEGVSVSNVLVAAGSQAEQAVPWLLEGDYLEVVGCVAKQTPHLVPQPRWGFLVGEIHPASRPLAATRAAESDN